MSEQKPEDDDEALRARLSRLNDAIRAQEERRSAQIAPKKTAIGGGVGRAMSAGLNVFSEFVAAIIVGGGLGWLADYLLGSRPWMLMLFLFLGMAAGFWNIYRLGVRNAAEADKKEPPPGG